MSTDLSTVPANQLQQALAERQAEAAAARAELARRDAAQQAELAARQAEWDLLLVRKYAGVEARLNQQWMDHNRQGDEAARQGDLLGAVGAWVRAADVRRARAVIRQEAQAAASREGVEQRVTTAELRSLDLDLFARFERLAESGNDTRAQQIMTELVGEYPLELDDQQD